MKTKELIRQLQEADPTGEIECCVGNCDIDNVTVLPAYYDGNLQVITVRDERGAAIAGKLFHNGRKVQIEAFSFGEHVFFEHGVFEIDYSDLGESPNTAYVKEFYTKRVAEVERNEYEIELNHFLLHVGKRAGLDIPNTINHTFVERIPKDLRKRAVHYFNRHYGAYAPMPEDLCVWRETDGRKSIGSWHERREEQWLREVDVLTETGFAWLRPTNPTSDY